MCSSKNLTECKLSTLWTFTTLSHFLCRFRWVYCQILYLRRCFPGRIRHALDELPETLDETYERALRDIDKANWEFVHRLLQCVAVAFRPLRVTELAEILSFDFKTGQIPKYNEGWSLGDPNEAVLSTTSSLLAIVNFKGTPFIQFSHFSVKEFLTSGRLAETKDIICRRYHISMTPAHTLVAQACISLILHLDKDVVGRDGLKKYPLVEYASKHWVDHSRFKGVSENVEGGMERLFEESHLAIWAYIHSPSDLLWTRRGFWGIDKAFHLGGPPLHYAAICGINAIVKVLVNQRLHDVNSRFEDDSTPLHQASRQGHVDVASFLLEHGADTIAQDKNGSTALHLALQHGHVNVVRLLLEHGADAEAQTKYGERPLHFAQDEEVARLLLEHGADTTAQTERGWTPLHRARHGDVARFLLEHGADATIPTRNGSTPLHLASENGREKVARVLLEHGADVTAQTEDGKTPLYNAVASEAQDVVCLLLEHGADVTAQTKDGTTPLHMAAIGGAQGVVRLLLEHGADVTAQDKVGTTPLHYAVGCNHQGVVRLLLEHGADVTAQNKNGATSLHDAAGDGYQGVVRLLLEHGADATAQNKYGRTPLHLAVQRRYVEVARVLVEHGADTTGMNEQAVTPWQVELHEGDLELVRIFGRDAEATP